MRIDDDLLAILACPACRAPLRVSGGDGGAAPDLLCTGCLRAYPVQDDIPVLLVDQAREPEPPVARADEPPGTEEPADGG